MREWKSGRSRRLSSTVFSNTGWASLCVLPLGFEIGRHVAVTRNRLGMEIREQTAVDLECFLERGVCGGVTRSATSLLSTGSLRRKRSRRPEGMPARPNIRVTITNPDAARRCVGEYDRRKETLACAHKLIPPNLRLLPRRHGRRWLPDRAVIERRRGNVAHQKRQTDDEDLRLFHETALRWICGREQIAQTLSS